MCSDVEKGLKYSKMCFSVLIFDKFSTEYIKVIFCMITMRKISSQLTILVIIENGGIYMYMYF